MESMISDVQKRIRVGTRGEDYGSWMSNPVFYVFGGLALAALSFTVFRISSRRMDAKPSWSAPLRPYMKRESALPSFWKKLIVKPRFLRGNFVCIILQEKNPQVKGNFAKFTKSLRFGQT